MAASASRKSLVVLLAEVLGALGGYVVLLIVGRYLEPSAYGAYLFAVSLLGIVVTFFQLGFGQAHTREVATGRPMATALGVFTRIRTALIAGYLITVVGGLFVWYQILGRSFTDATTLQVVLVILASSLLVQWRRVAGATWRGQGLVHRTHGGNVVDAAVFALCVCAVGLAVASVSGRWIPVPAFGAALASLLGITERPPVDVLALYLAFSHFIGKLVAFVLFGFWWFRDRMEIGPWDRELAREYTRFALPFAFVGVLSVLLLQTDILMIGYFWDSHEVGLYGAAKRLAKFALLPTIALRTILFPYFSSLMGRGESAQALIVFRQAERYLLLFVVPLAVAMYSWAQAGIRIAVGNPFLGAAPALQFLAVWTIVMALNMPVRQKHMAVGNTRIVMQVVVINVVANVLLNLVFIPRTLLGFSMLGMGATGSAIATLLSTLLAYAYNRMRARQDFGIRWVDLAQLRVLAAGLGLGAFWWYLHGALPATAYDRVWELGTIGLVGGVVYFVLLLAVRGLRRDDIAFVRQALSPKGLADEMRGRGPRY